jgi:SAM-dependent methyltransferase
LNEDTRAVHDEILSLLVPSGATAVLDLGCGRGYHLQRLAGRVSQGTRLVGIDASPQSIEEARAAAAADPRLEFVTHDLATGIPFGDGEFDRVLSINLLEAIPDKAALLAEVHRVLRPEGRVVFAHYDWDSQLLDGDDKALVRKVVHAFSDWRQAWMADADGWMGRRLWRTFQQTGLFTGSVHTLVHTSTRFAPGSYGWERVQDFRGLVERGMIRAAEYERLHSALEELASREQYFYAITMFVFVGRRVEIAPPNTGRGGD